MTIELHDRRAQTSFLNRPWAGLLLGLIIIIAHYTRLLHPFEQAIVRLLAPVHVSAYHSVGSLVIKRDDHAVVSLDEAQAHIGALENQVKQLTIQTAHLQTLVEESKLLKAQQDFLEHQSYQSIPARVMSRSAEGLARIIIINRGSHDGLAVGYPVIGSDGVLVGTIQQVDTYSSHVLLTTSLDSLVNGIISNPANSPGLLRGSYNTALRMELIPQTDAVTVGQSVVTSGADQYIPRGLVIGVIESVTDVPNAVFRTATVTPLFDLDQLFIVSIIIP